MSTNTSVQQQGIAKGDTQQKLGSAGFIIGAILMTIGSLLLPPTLGVSKWLEEVKLVGEQANLLQACALLITFGYWGVMIGTTGVYRSITTNGAPWARLGFYFHLMGTTMWTIGLSVGDVSYPAAAANWLTASAESKEAAYIALAAIPGFTRGLFPIEVLAIWLAFTFLGIGMVRSDVYPSWLGWIGLLLGVVGIPLGIMQTFAGRESTLGVFMVLNIATILWTLAVGIWVGRKAW
jgi:hypothetical protein